MSFVCRHERNNDILLASTQDQFRSSPLNDTETHLVIHMQKIWMKALSLVRSCSPGERIGLVAIVSLTIFGLSQIGQGLYIKAKAQMAQLLLENAWERALVEEKATKPWPWADTWPVAKLSVPRLGMSAVVLNDVSGEAMAFGPGHVSNTAEPGTTGTSVIAAHRDTHFQFLKHLAVGDEITVKNKLGETRTYSVKRMKIVHWDNSGIDPDADGQNLALVTCWPFETTTQGPLRFVVEAESLPELKAPERAASKQQHL